MNTKKIFIGLAALLLSLGSSKAVNSNYALSLPGGTDGNLSNVAIPALNISSLPVTIEMWFMPDAAQNYYSTLMYNRNATSNTGIQYDRWGDATKIKLVWNNTQPTVLHTSRPVAGSWNHVALVITATSKTMYLNGVAQTETGTFANYAFDAVTYLGWDKPNATVLDRTFKGLIDEVRVWNTARTSTEIKQNKYKILSGTESGLLGYWNFNDQAVKATDVSGHALDGTISGGSYVPGLDVTDSDADGVPDSMDNCPNTFNSDQADKDLDGVGDVCDNQEVANKALYFPGISGAASNVKINGLNLKTLPFTLEMWIKPEGTQTYNAGLFYNGTSNKGIEYASSWYNPANSIRFMADGGDQYGTLTTLNAVEPGKWHHLAVVMTSTTRTAYVDGNKLEETASFNPIDWSTGNLYLGWDSQGDARAFKGLMDEVRVWNTARTAEELKTDRFNLLTGKESGLAGYWNFDDQAMLATDLTGKGANGAITGCTYASSDFSSPMKYLSSTCTQKNITVNATTADLVVLGFSISAENAAKPLRLKKLNFSTRGTTTPSDINTVRIYGTGKNNVFSNNSRFAEFDQTPGTDFTINSDLELSTGINNFWVVYEVNKDIAAGSTLDAELKSIVLLSDTSLSSYVPTITAPSGKLTLSDDENTSIVTTEAARLSGGTSANFVAFQQSAIMTYKGYQYVTYWNAAYHVCIARRSLPDGRWEELELTQHTINQTRFDDNHYNISMGICASDGTIHVSYDHHNDPLRYQVSIPGLANDPSLPWRNESFGAKRDYLVEGVSLIDNPNTSYDLYEGSVTYPRFISKPNGDLLFECRTGISGDGNSHLWDYSGSDHKWTYTGEYMHGRADGMPAGYTDKCGYINGMHYTPGGTRLHISLVWRETPDATSNHEVYYAYSDDDGHTWYNTAGSKIATSGSSPLNYNSPGFQIMSIGQSRGLINQESQAVDSKGRIHILQSCIPDADANNSNWYNSRVNSVMRHIYQDENGVWQKDPIALSNINRSQIAVDASDNLYVVAPNYRVYSARASEGWKTWRTYDLSGSTKALSEGQIDREMLLRYGILSFVFPSSENNGKIIVPQYVVDKTTAAPLVPKDDRVGCFPNPFKDSFTIQHQGDFGYSILDLSGKLLDSGIRKDEAVLGLSLDSGIYLVQVKQKDKTLVSRVLKL